jgi:hypothetical protein
MPVDVVGTGDYQSAERKFGLSRQMLEACLELGFSISVLVLRGLDLLVEINQRARAVMRGTSSTRPTPRIARPRGSWSGAMYRSESPSTARFLVGALELNGPPHSKNPVMRNVAVLPVAAFWSIMRTPSAQSLGPFSRRRPCTNVAISLSVRR